MTLIRNKSSGQVLKQHFDVYEYIMLKIRTTPAKLKVPSATLKHVSWYKTKHRILQHKSHRKLLNIS
ncbi:hypothetical protein MtrunA17_Chr3g0120321 [Medicago truncatula]|uniref:Uncharacterized protein n=1 Tax=Medicago truncatula TaxID=3880 RepID=I3SNJ1_MEDTR|nr:unknown [Medicago truncatula]RHN69027.1 hypothetical protein MtrunA17_Chr3g0120321 [Medicago truncatula]